MVTTKTKEKTRNDKIYALVKEEEAWVFGNLLGQSLQSKSPYKCVGFRRIKNIRVDKGFFTPCKTKYLSFAGTFTNLQKITFWRYELLLFQPT